MLLPPFLQGRDTLAPRGRAAGDAGTQPNASEAVIIDWGVSDGRPVKETWGALDDVVMGGVSSSRLAVEDAAGAGAARRLVFSGRTSRENNGGFCSFRSRLLAPPLDLSGYEGLVFSARCRDGLRYKLQLRDNDGWDSLGWALGFDTLPGGAETEVRLPLASLVPNFRSQTQRGAAPLRTESICSLQLVLSAFEFDKRMNPRFKEGEFRLELGPIRAYRRAG